MNRKQKIIVSVVGITIVLLALLGITYAYYLTRIQGNTNTNSISVTTADLKLVYNDGTDGVIGGENLEPSDTVYTKTFTVTNEGNGSVDYGVYLIDVINTFERKDDIKYTITCTSDGEECTSVTTETIFPSGISELVTNTIETGVTQTYTLSFTYKDTGTDQSVDMGKELSAKIQIYGENSEGVIIPYETNTLAFSILNNASSGSNGTILSDPLTTVATQVSSSTYGKTESTSYPSTKSSIITSNTYTYASDYTIDSSGKFTLVDPQTVVYSSGYEILKGMYIVSISGSTSTTAATSSSISTIYKVSPTEVTETSFNYISVNKYISTEKVLATAEDDYGVSYYYRGGVENNYVNFADMCWRIVRIQGDGSVKLILEDQDSICESSDGNWNIPASNGTELTLNTSTSTAYTTGNFGNEYLIDSDKYIASYLNPVTSSDISMINAFKYFQSLFKSAELEKLKVGDWCYADTAYASSSADVTTATPLTESEKNTYYTNGTSFYYDSYVRLYGASTKSPTLKCNGTKLSKFSDNTEMYVSALTADEIVYAGADTDYNSNYAYYLLNDYQRGKSLYWWALSPYFFLGNYGGYAFYVYNDGYLDYDIVSSVFSFRPAVSLASSAVITGGDGLKTNPYVVI